MDKPPVPRREFVKRSATALGAVSAAGIASAPVADATAEGSAAKSSRAARLAYNDVYEGPRLNRVAFPMGGLGAGMICLEGSGALSHVSLRNHPDVFNEPCTFAAIAVRGPRTLARVLEGPVPGWKIFGARNSANGDQGSSYGLPRFARARFSPRFPFATVTLGDDQVPLDVDITGWSPFVPGDADNSSLPVAGLEYRVTNSARESLDGTAPARPPITEGDPSPGATLVPRQLLLPPRDNYFCRFRPS